MSALRKLSFGASTSSRSSRLLAVLAALSVAGSLLYVFVLLVPAWRDVRVNRGLLDALLTNHSASARLWEAFERDPLLRSRSANAFRQCLADTDATDEDTGRGGGGGGRNNATADVRGYLKKPELAALKWHMLELLAGVNGNSSATWPTEMTTTSTTTAPATTTTTPRSSASSSLSSERCWFLNLHWSSDAAASASAGSQHSPGRRGLLNAERALFLLAVAALLCHCVGLTGALYACFAARMSRPCRLVLLAVHGLTLSQLVALAILQDVAARLEVERLADLLAAAGFPDGCQAAVGAHRGVCSFALMCVLCLTSGLSLLLLPLLPTAPAGGDDEAAAAAVACTVQRRRTLEEDAEKDEAGAAAAAAGKTAECDDAAGDTSPLVM